MIGFFLGAISKYSTTSLDHMLDWADCTLSGVFVSSLVHCSRLVEPKNNISKIKIKLCPIETSSPNDQVTDKCFSVRLQMWLR